MGCSPSDGTKKILKKERILGPVSYVGDYVKPRQLIALVQKLKLYSKDAFTYLLCV
jgi:hypothetical protein